MRSPTAAIVTRLGGTGVGTGDGEGAEDDAGTGVASIVAVGESAVCAGVPDARGVCREQPTRAAAITIVK
jgi:hypothetical protein